VTINLECRLLHQTAAGVIVVAGLSVCSKQLIQKSDKQLLQAVSLSEIHANCSLLLFETRKDQEQPEDDALGCVETRTKA
jgi:hypothetical protein